MERLKKIVITTIVGLVVSIGLVQDVSAESSFEGVYNLEIVERVNEEKGLVEFEDYVYLYEGDRLVGIDYSVGEVGGRKGNKGVYKVVEGTPTKEDENSRYLELSKQLKSRTELESWDATAYVLVGILVVAMIASVWIKI